MPAKLITCQCAHCGAAFLARKVRPGKFCSRTCYHNHPRTDCAALILIGCTECGAVYRTLAHAPQRYCSSRCSGKARAKGYPARFWAMAKKTESCWLWTGTRSRSGYGRFEHQGRRYQAHRVAWELTCGTIPDNLFVCHNCPGGDNRRCVNPKHLYLGTAADNNRDTQQKGRSARGERNYNAKLTGKAVLEIRERFARGGIAKSRLATEYGVSPTTIGLAIARKTWREV